MLTALLLTVVLASLVACTDDSPFYSGQQDVAAQGDMRRVKIAVTEEDWRTEQVTVNQYGMTTRAGETMIQLKTNSARSWDFTRTSALDIAALASDAANWTNVDSKGLQFKSKTAVSGATLKGGPDGTTELTLTAGLLFSGVTATEGDVRFDVNKCLMLNSSGICITLPELKKGQEVTVEFATTSDSKSRNIVPGGSVSSTAAITSTSTATHAKCKVTMTADGSPTFTVGTGTDGSAVYLYSIDVSPGIDEGFGLYSTRLGVDNSHVVWDPDILNWAGKSNDFYLMLWPNNIIKYSMRFNATENVESSKISYFSVTDAAGIERTNKYVNPGASPDAGAACSYQGTSFTHGLKMKEGTQITWTSGANGGNKTKLTIIQSNWKTSDKPLQQIELDGEALAISGKTAPAGKDWVCVATAIEGGVEYVIRNVEAGAHKIQRGEGHYESGILYVCIDIDFTAYSPYVAEGTFANGSTTYGVTARDANSLTFAPHTDNRIDLLYAEDFTDNDGTVHLNFKHALGKLSIGTITNDYGEPISLKQITLKGTKITKGTMSLHTGEWTIVTTNGDDIVYNETALLSLFGSLSIPDKGSLVFPSYVNYQQIPGSTITFEYLFENSAGKQLKVTKDLPIVQGVNTYINIRVDQNHAVVLE